MTAAAHVAVEHREGRRPVALPHIMGPGVVFRDLDGDGLPDLLFVGGSGNPRFTYLRNAGDGTFADVTLASGLDASGWGMGALAADLDADGDQDLVFTFYGSAAALYENAGDGTFRGRALPAETNPGTPFGTGLAALDARGTGRLDVFAASYVEFPRERVRDPGPGGVTIRGRWQPRGLSPFLPNPRESRFFLNEGGLKFREAAREWGVTNRDGKALAAVVLDVNDDARPDLFVADDVTPCALYRNEGDRFENVAVAAWVADVAGSMGLALCDYDHDGLLDLFCSRWIQEHHALYRANRRRDGGVYYTNMAQVAGFTDLGTDHVGWGCAFLDANGDGWEDLLVLEGHTFVDESHERLVAQVPLLLYSEGGKSFARAPAEPGSVLATALTARGAAFADMNNDGALDVAIAQNLGAAKLWRAVPPPGHWLALDLVGTTGNRDAIASVVTVKAGDLTLTHPVTSGDSYLSTSTARVMFRIAGETSPRVTIRWPSGQVEEVGEVAVDRVLRRVEP